MCLSNCIYSSVIEFVLHRLRPKGRILGDISTSRTSIPGRCVVAQEAESFCNTSNP